MRENMRKLLIVAIPLLVGVSVLLMVCTMMRPQSVSPQAIGGKSVVWLGPNSGVDIGDVTLNNTNAITMTLGGETISATLGSGVVEITATSSLPVDVASATITTGTISVDDGGSSLTVDGSVTADTELAVAVAAAEGASNPTVPQVGSMSSLYNSATWDRERGNWSEWPFPSDCYTYTAPVVGEWVELTNYNARGAYIVVSITGIGEGQTLTVYGAVYDYGSGSSGQMETIWSSAALTPTGRHTYLIYPGAGAAAQDVVATVSYPLPRLWNLGVTVANSEPITFSIGVHYIN